MDTSKKLLHLVRLAASSLALTGPLYKNVDGLDTEYVRERLGKALATIFDIDKAMCDVLPKLTSDEWKLICQDKESFKAEMERLDSALAEEALENVDVAEKLFAEIESSTPIEDNRVRAQAGLYRLSSKT